MYDDLPLLTIMINYFEPLPTATDQAKLIDNDKPWSTMTNQPSLIIILNLKINQSTVPHFYDTNLIIVNHQLLVNHFLWTIGQLCWFFY